MDVPDRLPDEAVASARCGWTRFRSITRRLAIASNASLKQPQRTALHRGCQHREIRPRRTPLGRGDCGTQSEEEGDETGATESHHPSQYARSGVRYTCHGKECQMIPGKRALVVDDSRSARVVLTRMLERYGILVDAAESAEAALDYLKEKRPDVIFMDHLMPGMDGLQAVREIKAQPELAAIPIMMYTSQEGEIYSGQARASGAVGVLPKSIRPIDVTKALYQLQLLPDRRIDEPSGLEAGRDHCRHAKARTRKRQHTRSRSRRSSRNRTSSSVGSSSRRWTRGRIASSPSCARAPRSTSTRRRARERAGPPRGPGPGSSPPPRLSPRSRSSDFSIGRRASRPNRPSAPSRRSRPRTRRWRRRSRNGGSRATLRPTRRGRQVSGRSSLPFPSVNRR